MRTDLNKLLCERERRRSTNNHRPYRRAKKFAPDLDPVDGGKAGQEGMSFRYGYDGKDFNENLTPLYGQVRKAVGKPWDKFYSELCKVFDKRSVINQHILGHLNDFVERNVYEKNGKLYINREYGFEKDTPLEESFCEFYVGPHDGIIKRNKHRTTYRQRLQARRLQEEKEQAKIYVPISDKQALGKIGEIWFVLDIEELPPGESKWDVYRGGYVARNKYIHPINKTYHVRKRSASKKLLKQHGLR